MTNFSWNAQVNKGRIDNYIAPTAGLGSQLNDQENPNRMGIFYHSITFSDGTEIPLQRDSIIVLTGPNNCGKNQTLRDLVSFGSSNIAVMTANASIIGNPNKIIENIVLHPGMQGNESFIRSNYDACGRNIISFILSQRPNIQFYDIIIQSMIKYITTANRLNGIQTVHIPRQNIINQPNTYPSQLKNLFEDKIFEDNFYELIAQAFGKGVLINRYSFQNPNLHFFDREEIANNKHSNSKDFADWFSNLPLLDFQGDGIRSFCSVLLTVMDSPRPCVLLDEPEAFLHPPQVRRLAKAVAQNAAKDSQIIISSHSADFLQGLLDFADKRINVIRMMRKKDLNREINAIKFLKADDITEFWRDPLLKTSDALTALFHDVAVIVEGDSDARFLRAMIDQSSYQDKERLPDIRFYHCGGKDRIYKIVSALKSTGVPVVCVVDIDVLDDKKKFLTLFNSLGSEEPRISSDIDFIHRFMSEKRSVMNAVDVKSEILAKFENINLQKPLPNSVINSIGEIITSASIWKFVKSNGDSFFTRGEPYNKFTEIRQLSEERGLIINEFGELENFDKSIEARKSEWLAQVMEKDLASDENLENARNFSKKLLAACHESIQKN